MSRFWERRSETELERRLRAERPQAPERLVSMLSQQPRRSGRPRLVPRLAVVGVVTAVMLAALGAFGAAGYASTAFLSFNSNIRDVVRPSSTSSSKPSVSSKQNGDDGKGQKAGETDEHQSNGGKGQDDDDPGNASPWQDQYHQTWPVCHKGRFTLYLPLPAYTAHLLHGDQPGPC
jgi:hypothetical protein